MGYSLSIIYLPSEAGPEIYVTHGREKRKSVEKPWGQAGLSVCVGGEEG